MNRRKFLRGAATAAVAAALPAAALGLALKKPEFDIVALGGEFGGKVGERLFPVGDRIDGFHLEEGERLLITGAANPQANGVYTVTKSSLAEAALRSQKDLVDGVTKQLLETNRLFDEIPWHGVRQNQSHLVYDRNVHVVDWRHPSFSVDDEELVSERNKTVEVKNDLKFYDENGKEQPFPRATLDEQRAALVGLDIEADLTQDHLEELISGFAVTARIEELMDKADRPENSFFPRSRVLFKEETTFGFVPAPKENEYA